MLFDDMNHCSILGRNREASLRRSKSGDWQLKAFGYCIARASCARDRVKDGILHGPRGIEHQANWLTVDDTIQRDGGTELFVRGIISDPVSTVGGVPTGSKLSRPDPI